MADPAAKKRLSDLIKQEGLDNKRCIDCANPNPQWASVSFAIFLCLQCAGTHRGFGVHISFVRSVSMDSWQEDQLKRMELGGNAPFRHFLRSYQPPEQGGYQEGQKPYDTYHCWAAAQYKDKLDALLAGNNNWSPSSPPPTWSLKSRSASPAPSTAQNLRKSRATANARSLSSNTPRSGSPSSLSPAQNASGSSLPVSVDQKIQNEAYFAHLGRLNENRPTDLPPSQGGRYQGFGSTPNPPTGGGNSHPSLGLSSANAPTLTELQENPMAALSKGWSLFSSVVAGATKVVSETVIQPGMEKMADPNFQASVRGYMTEAQKKALEVGEAANAWSKNQLGIDVADTVHGVKEKVLGGPERTGYGRVDVYSENEGTGLYSEGSFGARRSTDDEFGRFQDGYHDGNMQEEQFGWAGSSGSASVKPTTNTTGAGTMTSRAKAKKDDDWEEWQDW